MKNLSKKALIVAPVMALVLSLVSALGCDPQQAGNSGDVVFEPEPIIGGTAPNRTEHNAVVALFQKKKKRIRGPICSGTLIRNNVVLTASHCLKNSLIKKKAKRVAVYFGNDALRDPLVLNANVFLANQVATHPSYDGFSVTNDVALIRLSTRISSAIAPVANLPAAKGITSADIGNTVNEVGFGVYDENSDTGFGLKLQINNQIAQLGDPNGYNPQMFIGYAAQNNGVCFGDSGGPDFIYRNGVPYVAAVHSYLVSNNDMCAGSRRFSTRVDTYESFINSF